MEKNGQWGTQSKGQLKSGAGVRGAFTQNSYCNKSLLFLFITRWAYKLGAKMGNHFIANDRFILICSGWSYQTVSGRKGSCWKIQQEMQGRGGCEYDLCFSMYGSRKYAYFPTEGFFQFDPPPPDFPFQRASHYSPTSWNFHDFSTWSLLPPGNSKSTNKEISLIYFYLLRTKIKLSRSRLELHNFQTKT